LEGKKKDICREEAEDYRAQYYLEGDGIYSRGTFFHLFKMLRISAMFFPPALHVAEGRSLLLTRMFFPH
jgi:hypothetical protein